LVGNKKDEDAKKRAESCVEGGLRSFTLLRGLHQKLTEEKSEGEIVCTAGRWGGRKGDGIVFPRSAHRSTTKTQESEDVAGETDLTDLRKGQITGTHLGGGQHLNRNRGLGNRGRFRKQLGVN